MKSLNISYTFVLLMVILEKMKIGPKGQVVIPQFFRKKLNIISGSEIVFTEKEAGVLMEKSAEDIVAKAREAAQKIKHRGKINISKLQYGQISQRLLRAGIRV